MQHLKAVSLLAAEGREVTCNRRRYWTLQSSLRHDKVEIGRDCSRASSRSETQFCMRPKLLHFGICGSEFSDLWNDCQAAESSQLAAAGFTPVYHASSLTFDLQSVPCVVQMFSAGALSFSGRGRWYLKHLIISSMVSRASTLRYWLTQTCTLSTIRCHRP